MRAFIAVGELLGDALDVPRTFHEERPGPARAEGLWVRSGDIEAARADRRAGDAEFLPAQPGLLPYQQRDAEIRTGGAEWAGHRGQYLGRVLQPAGSLQRGGHDHGEHECGRGETCQGEALMRLRLLGERDYRGIGDRGGGAAFLAPDGALH